MVSRFARRSLSLTLAAGLGGAPALAGRPPTAPVDACPWTGRPHVQDINDRGLIIAGVEFKFARSDDALQFKRVLVACDASSVLDAFANWRAAEMAVTAQGAGAAADAMVGGVGAAMQTDPRQKATKAAATVDSAVDNGVVIAQLNAAATNLRDNFVLALEATVAPARSAPVAGAPPIPVVAEAPPEPSAPSRVIIVHTVEDPPPEPSSPAPVPVDAPVVPAPEPVAVAEPPESRSEPELSSFLASTDQRERLQGVKNLRKRTDDDSILLLRRVLRDESTETVALAAIEALSARASTGAGDFDLLVSSLVVGTTRVGSTAVAATEALGRFSEHPDHLLDAMRHPDASVRAAAVTAALKMRVRVPETFDWPGFLAPLAEDPSPEVRTVASSAIATLDAAL